MSKGLEKLKELHIKLCENCSYNKPDMDGDVCSKCEEALSIIEQELRAFDIIRKYVWKGYRNNNVDNDLRDIKKQLEAVRIIKKYRHFDVWNGDLVVHVPDGDEEDKEYKLLEEIFADE